MVIILAMVGLSSCEDFLNRPDPGAYTLADFYKNDEQLKQAANILYNSPWHDFTRGFIGVGDAQAGNHYSGGDGFYMLNHESAGIEQTSSNMSAALWSVNARANTTLENINMYAGPATTEAGRNTYKGEVLVWKAMAYFYLVRIYGAVPIIHDNSQLLADNTYNEVDRIKIDIVYDYIVMTLEKAIEWLPEKNLPGRIDKYSAYGLLAKVYLAKSGYGQSGSRNTDDLAKAAEYARLVVNNSGRSLEPVYSDIFRGHNNFGPESLIAWHWTISGGAWTAANPIQADLGQSGFDEHNCWGDWTGPSYDLQMAFGEEPWKLTRQNTDSRRQATMMMYGDVYPYFWRDHPTKKDAEGADVPFPDGFDYTLFRRKIAGQFASVTGSNAVKHLVGNNADHAAELGSPMLAEMSAGNSTHILRLADVYLVLAEALLGNNASLNSGEGLAAFNAVRRRAGVEEKTSITFDDIFKERRLELAYEGDNWYDYVRLSYYNNSDAMARLRAQKRGGWIGLSGGEDTYLFNGVEGLVPDTGGKMLPRYDDGDPNANLTFSENIFTMPFPDTDQQMNPKMKDGAEPQDFDLSTLSFE